MNENKNDDFFMNLALKEAQKAFEVGEIPVGAVLVHENKIIAKAHNQTQILNDPTAHAEMLCVTAACHSLGTKYLINCCLYITLEPCVMCAGAIKWAQLPRIVFGASDPKGGFYSQTKLTFFHPKTEIISGVLETECSQILKHFFKLKR